jgi:hypothetical protein
MIELVFQIIRPVIDCVFTEKGTEGEHVRYLWCCDLPATITFGCFVWVGGSYEHISLT